MGQTSTIVQKVFKNETYSLFGIAQATGSNGKLVINNSVGQSKQLQGVTYSGADATLSTGSVIEPADTGLYAFVWDVPAQTGLGAGSAAIFPSLGGPISSLDQNASVVNQVTSLSFLMINGVDSKAVALVSVTDVSGNLENLASGSTLQVTAHFSTSPVF